MADRQGTTGEQLARIETKLDALTEKLDAYTTRTDQRVGSISTRLDQVELAQARSEHLEDEVDALKGQSRRWDLLNSIGTLAAGLLAFFKK